MTAKKRYWELQQGYSYLCLETTGATDAVSYAREILDDEITVSFSGPPSQRAIGLTTYTEDAFRELFSYLYVHTPPCLCWKMLEAVDNVYAELYGKHPVVRGEIKPGTTISCQTIAKEAHDYVCKDIMGLLPDQIAARNPKTDAEPKVANIMQAIKDSPQLDKHTNQSYGMVQKPGGYVLQNPLFINPSYNPPSFSFDPLATPPPPKKPDPPKPFQSPGKRKFKYGK